MKYGTPVAFISDHMIKFGTIHEVVTRQGKGDQQVEIHISHHFCDGEKAITVVRDEDEVIELNHFNSQYKLADFAGGSPGFR